MKPGVYAGAYAAICARAVAYARDINDSRRPATTWVIKRLCVVRPEIVLLLEKVA